MWFKIYSRFQPYEIGILTHVDFSTAQWYTIEKTLKLDINSFKPNVWGDYNVFMLQINKFNEFQFHHYLIQTNFNLEVKLIYYYVFLTNFICSYKGNQQWRYIYIEEKLIINQTPYNKANFDDILNSHLYSSINFRRNLKVTNSLENYWNQCGYWCFLQQLIIWIYSS